MPLNESKAQLERRSLDDEIEIMADRTLGDVIYLAEGKDPRIGFPKHYSANATTFLVARLFTDAVFNQDIRAIQNIVNRIDGGLPKDTDVTQYQTKFGDCINELLTYPLDARHRISPDDSIMMAMCKSLYDIATQDIYWNEEKQVKVRKPPTDKKNERDAAMRMILDRAGGRKTHMEQAKEIEIPKVAGWIEALM